jgi:3-dehydroquinate synthase
VQEVQLKQSRMFVWHGIHVEAGENIRALAPDIHRLFVVTDRPCVEIARRTAMSLQQARYDVHGGVVPATKGPARPAPTSQLLAKLAALGDEMVAVLGIGGTSVLHLAVKLAGARPCFLVPTTLRGQLDAALGGASCPLHASPWRPPRVVFSDPTLLKTLPLREYVAGLAEAAKCAMVQDPDLFEFLESNAAAIRNRDRDPLGELIYQAGTVKAKAVDSPTPGPGARATLRYGHLVGGALERLAGSAVLHGEAIAVGMEAEAFISRRLGWADDELLESQNRLLKVLGLPTRAKGLPAGRLAEPLVAKGTAKPDLPDAIGHAKGPAEVPVDLLKAAVAAVTK